jgi:Bacterial pre-peptidase C-terminal domain/Viral BACON domain
MRVLVRRIPPTATIVLLLLCLAATSRSQSMPGYQAPDKAKDQSPASVKAARGEAPLSKLYGHLKADSAKAKRLAPLKKSDIPKESKNEKLHRIGLVRDLPSALDPLTDSAIYVVKEGEVRVLIVGAEGARKLRVQFRDFSLPAGARVFVYSASDPNVYFGPYEGRGPWNDGIFWTPSMPGDQVVIEYTAPAGTTTIAPFKVSRVAHIYKDATAADDPAAFCNLEVADPWNNVKKSVAMLEFITGPFVADCTGTLLNDSNTSIDAFVLTAHHCISTQAEAQSTFAYWFYDSGETPPSGTASIGFDLSVTGSESDFTLLHRAGVIPGLFYSGWDASPVSAATSITGIHHPNGSHKRISFGATNANCASFVPGPCANFTGVTWSSGITEGGSSGSGLWTGTGDSAKLVGSLTAGESSCATPAASDFYSRFSVTYPNVSGFLNGSCVSSISPGSQSFPEGGGSGSITVTAPGGCAWTASSAESFVTITSGSSGTGPGTVNFSVAANVNGLQRTAYVVVGAQVFKVSQAAGGTCAPAPINFGQTVNGALATSDCHAEDHYIDSYSFSGTAGQHVAIDMSSNTFDTYLFLVRSDGTLVAENDDASGTNSRIPQSGFLTLPATDTYTILATSYDPNTTGAYSLSLIEQAKHTLTVASTPDSGVTITVTPADVGGNSDGQTQFTRNYYQGTTVVLNAPGLFNGKEFKAWQKDGVTVETTNVVIASTDADHTYTAVYGPITTYNFTFKSSNPDSGVAIEGVTTDNNGASNGTTTFTRTYNRNTNVFFSAPQNAPNGNLFQKWQRADGYSETSRFISTTAFADSTWTAVYVVPVIFSLTVNSSNPAAGVNITVSPTDNNGSGDGTAPFARTYNQATHVFLTAPAAAPNGNVFDRWVKPNGDTASFSRSFDFFMAANTAFTAVYATKPFVWLENGTTNAFAVHSVTFVRGPFQILDSHNFSTDGHTRIILFTSGLGLTQADLVDPAVLVVTVQTTTGTPVLGFTLPIEAVGPYAGAGLTGSYIVVKIPDGIPTGQFELRVRLRQTTSDASFLTLIP